MVRPRKFDADEVLEGAVAIFRERGFEGAKVPDLIAELGICRQSLYSAFGDKRGLYLQALSRWGQREVEAKIAVLEAPGSPLENLRTVLRGFAAYATACPNEGCFTVTAMVENRDDPEAMGIVEAQVQRMEAAYAASIARAIAAGELRPDTDAQRIARTFIVIGHGIGLLVRLPDSSARVGAAVSEMLALLDDQITAR